MEEDERKQLQEVLRIVQHNNRLLRRMRREVLIGRFIHLLYWIIILGLGFVGYFYLMPYINQLTQAVQDKNISLPIPGK